MLQRIPGARGTPSCRRSSRAFRGKASGCWVPVTRAGTSGRRRPQDPGGRTPGRGGSHRVRPGAGGGRNALRAPRTLAWSCWASGPRAANDSDRPFSADQVLRTFTCGRRGRSLSVHATRPAHRRGTRRHALFGRYRASAPTTGSSRVASWTGGGARGAERAEARERKVRG